MILITGSSGRLGKELSKYYPDVLTPSHQELDVTNIESVEKYLSENKPDIIIHLAAMTSVTGCEDNKNDAWKANVIGTINIIRFFYEINNDGYFILMSTPCVFDGKTGMYTENDIPNPENFYGLTKVVAESVVRSSPLKTLIISRYEYTYFIHKYQQVI